MEALLGELVTEQFKLQEKGRKARPSVDAMRSFAKKLKKEEPSREGIRVSKTEAKRRGSKLKQSLIGRKESQDSSRKSKKKKGRRKKAGSKVPEFVREPLS